MIINQKADSGSTVVSAKGGVSVTYNSVEDILNAASSLIPIFNEQARLIVEARLEKFKSEIKKDFIDNQRVDLSALGNPNFQDFLYKAQGQYISTDSDQKHTLLRDLIANKSICNDESRYNYVLDDALGVVNKLGVQELTFLSLIYIITEIHQSSVFRVFDIASSYIRVKDLLLTLEEPRRVKKYLLQQNLLSESLYNLDFIGILKAKHEVVTLQEVNYKNLLDRIHGLRGVDLPIFQVVNNKYYRFDENDESWRSMPPEQQLVVPMYHTKTNFISKLQSKINIDPKLIWDSFTVYDESIWSELLNKYKWINDANELYKQHHLKDVRLSPTGILIANMYLKSIGDSVPSVQTSI